MQFDFDADQRTRLRVNMIPLINLVFLMLIFFLLAGTFIEYRAMQLSFGDSRQVAATPAAQSLLFVRARADGSVQIDGSALSLEELREAIVRHVERDAERPVVVWADAELAVQQLVDVMDVLHSSGALNVRLSGTERGL